MASPVASESRLPRLLPSRRSMVTPLQIRKIASARISTGISSTSPDATMLAASRDTAASMSIRPNPMKISAISR